MTRYPHIRPPGPRRQHGQQHRLGHGGPPAHRDHSDTNDAARPFTRRRQEEGAGAAEENRQDIDPGQPGASARAEFERRRRRDTARRRRRFGRLLAPVVAALGGVPPSTAHWAIGGAADERVGLLLRAAVGEAGVVLHDPRPAQPRQHRPHRHRRHGCVGRRHEAPPRAGAPGPPPRRPRRTAHPRRQREGPRPPPGRGATPARAVVEAVVGPGTPVRAVLCFADASWAPLGRPFTLRGVTVTWPRALTRALTAPGPLGTAERDALARRLARTFPPYAPSGTSHRPTGASPGR